MKINLEKFKPYINKAKDLYQRRLIRYAVIAAAGLFLLFVGVFIEHYGIRRMFTSHNSYYSPSAKENPITRSVYTAKLLVDEKVFLEKIASLFEPKWVYDTYRQGLHTFSLSVLVNNDNKVVQHQFKWWNGNTYLPANHFIDSIKFQQVLGTIPFSNENQMKNEFLGRIDFELRIGISKEGKIVQPLMAIHRNDDNGKYAIGKYITKNDIMNKKGIYVDLSTDEIDQYTYKKNRTKPDTEPVPLNIQKVFDEKLSYPEKAKEMEIEGRVVLKVLINESGSVVAVSITKGLGGGCDEAAVKAAFDVKYKPALSNGKPVKSSAALPVIFKL